MPYQPTPLTNSFDTIFCLGFGLRITVPAISPYLASSEWNRESVGGGWVGGWVGGTALGFPRMRACLP